MPSCGRGATLTITSPNRAAASTLAGTTPSYGPGYASALAPATTTPYRDLVAGHEDEQWVRAALLRLEDADSNL